MGLNATLAAQMLNFLILLLLIYSLVYFLLIRPKKSALWHMRQANKEKIIMTRLDTLDARQEEQRQRLEKNDTEI